MSVDLLAFEDEHLVIAATSFYLTDERRQDVAWDVVRWARFIWTDESWPTEIAREPAWHMPLRLTIDDQRYECSGETMRRPAERRLERSDWETACKP